MNIFFDNNIFDNNSDVPSDSSPASSTSTPDIATEESSLSGLPPKPVFEKPSKFGGPQAANVTITSTASPSAPRAKRNFNLSNKKMFKSEFEEQVVKVKRISKTTKAGRQSRIWILVVVGNKKGKAGYGVGKSKEFPIAIKKAIKNATKNVVKIPMNSKGTVFHEYLGQHNSSKVLLKPAKPGTGIIAGSAIKKVLELAGFQNIYAKNLGSNTTINMLAATMDALLNQRSPAFIAKLRDKDFKGLFHLK